MTALHIDFETRSYVDLTKVGASRYAADPSTKVLCVAWAWGDDPVQSLILPTMSDMTNLVFDRFGAGDRVHAWNASFERAILRHCFTIFPSEWSCTMQRAAYGSLPASLEHAANAMHLAFQKDMAGNKLMREMM